MFVFIPGRRHLFRVALLYPEPVVVYVRCLDDAGRPAGYGGDWPVRHTVYAAHIKPSAHTGEPHVFLNGFHAEKPFGAFEAGRFEVVGRVGLN